MIERRLPLVVGYDLNLPWGWWAKISTSFLSLKRRSLLLIYFKKGLHGLRLKVEYFYVKVDLEGRTILPFMEKEIFLPRGSPCDLPLNVEIYTFTFKSVGLRILSRCNIHVLAYKSTVMLARAMKQAKKRRRVSICTRWRTWLLYV